MIINYFHTEIQDFFVYFFLKSLIPELNLLLKSINWYMLVILISPIYWSYRPVNYLGL